MNTDFIRHKKNTIVALSTPPGVGAIALIRVSGEQAISLVGKIFKGKNLESVPSHTIHFGRILDTQGEILDEVLVSIFKAPHSFTQENIAEISCHGSQYIISQILQSLVRLGARLALPGEFTQRAYLNGQIDLAQAEAIADLIASESKMSHQVAMQQMRGGYSQRIRDLRQDFIRLAALLELELDFAEEDVEFADRSDLQAQLAQLKSEIIRLRDSFQVGNAIKNGIPVAIIGKPNAGKSTLLNALLEDDKAIVSEIPGTTRDAIEDEQVIEGLRFRFIDTAGLRETEDTIEKIGVERTRSKMQSAQIILYLFDAVVEKHSDVLDYIKELHVDFPHTQIITVANKMDEFARFDLFLPEGEIWCGISAKEKTGLEQLKKLLCQSVLKESTSDVIVTNLRHYESLVNTLQALDTVENALTQKLSSELIASDMREAIYHLGSIVGEVSNEDLLDFIFSKFCIGK
ncbi:MAG: tRNA uridine-5-carboxymethylaminomethyl(34) synthesis GTPase MnmE [Microscillaceae bacterium]|nr:tRNA uridine-5-carboxymethylaminomethyl(34) synthesis GTPase MnmE [Microscillaceae bacterium]